MLSKKRVRTKSNTRTKSKRITKSRKFNKKRVKRVSTKQRGGVKRRRTKKSKKKSQKGGNFKIKRLRFEIMTKINLLPILDWQKQELLDMFKQYPEQVEQVEQIITKINNGEEYETAMAAVSEQLPKYNHPPSENGKCEGWYAKDTECENIINQTDCETKTKLTNLTLREIDMGQTVPGKSRQCKWTPA